MAATYAPVGGDAVAVPIDADGVVVVVFDTVSTQTTAHEIPAGTASAQLMDEVPVWTVLMELNVGTAAVTVPENALSP